MFDDGLPMRGGGISLVAIESVHGPFSMQLKHLAITGHLGENGRGRDILRTAVSLDQRTLFYI